MTGGRQSAKRWAARKKWREQGLSEPEIERRLETMRIRSRLDAKWQENEERERLKLLEQFREMKRRS